MRLNRKFTLYKVEDRVPFNPFIYLIIDPARFFRRKIEQVFNRIRNALRRPFSSEEILQK